MTINKDSAEVVNFMRLFGKLKEWSEDEPESLPELASTDEPIKELCLQLLKAAGSLQRFERSAPDLFTAPVESKFISNWRDFEKRLVPALLTVRFNALMSREWDFSSFGYEHSPGWEDADQEAARAEVLIESMMNGELEAIMSLGHSRHDGDMAEVAVKPVAASTAESRGPRISINAFPKEFKEKVIAIYTFRNELLERARLCDDELLKSKLNNMLTSLSLMGIDDYGVPIEDALKEAREDWKSLKDEAGLDLRGVFRRRALVPFVLFPRHVAAHQGRTDKLSIYEILREAHQAFVFGVPSAAVALMRSIMEVVLRDHYGANGAHLSERISNSRRLLPRGANEAALHRLKKLANAILHLDADRDEGLQKLERIQLEQEIVSLLFVLRALIEGAPQWHPR